MNARAFNVTELAGGGVMPPDVLDALTAQGAALYGLPAAEYHQHEALSYSGACRILQSPKHYRLFRTQQKAPTDEMAFGTVVHACVLEPDKVADVVCCLPHDAPDKPSSRQRNAKKPSPATVEAIAYWDDFQKRAQGRIVLGHDDYQRAMRCVDAILNHPAAARLLDGGQREVSLFWKDGKYKVPCKSRLDVLNLGGLVDVKTTRDASPEAFARSIANYRYHMQSAHYFSGCEHVLDSTPEFSIIIAAESEEPHGVAVYELPSNAILAGAHLMNIALGRYADALASGGWPGYADTIQTIQLPRWATTFAV